MLLLSISYGNFPDVQAAPDRMNVFSSLLQTRVFLLLNHVATAFQTKHLWYKSGGNGMSIINNELARQMH